MIGFTERFAGSYTAVYSNENWNDFMEDDIEALQKQQQEVVDNSHAKKETYVPPPCFKVESATAIKAQKAKAQPSSSSSDRPRPTRAGVLITPELSLDAKGAEMLSEILKNQEQRTVARRTYGQVKKPKKWMGRSDHIKLSMLDCFLHCGYAHSFFSLWQIRPHGCRFYRVETHHSVLPILKTTTDSWPEDTV